MYHYLVTAHTLNIRGGDDITYPIVGFVHKGDIVVSYGAPLGNWLKITQPTDGWVSIKFLTEIQPDSLQHSNPLWLEIAYNELGQQEIKGKEHNPRIIEYLKSTTLPAASAHQDETPWCSAFVNWCIEQAGYEGTDSAWAKSWLNWGRSIHDPTKGCLAIFTRGALGGHVGFFIEQLNRNQIKLLGGNQRDSVSIAIYSTDRLLGYKMPG